MFLLYHAYVYLEFLILACTIYILAPNRVDEAICGRAWTVAKTQNKNDSHEAMEEAENHLQKPKLSKLEEPKRIQSGRYS